MSSANYYHVLGVAQDATAEQIKSAYRYIFTWAAHQIELLCFQILFNRSNRKLAIKYHPDKNPEGEETVSILKIIGIIFRQFLRRIFYFPYQIQKAGIILIPS